jgi:hypothetical protein
LQDTAQHKSATANDEIAECEEIQDGWHSENLRGNVAVQYAGSQPILLWRSICRAVDAGCLMFLRS